MKSGPASQPGDGRRARGDRARASLLQQAVQIASIDGLEGLTLGRLALAAGVGKSNVSVLFGNKERVQAETLDAAVALFAERVIKPSLAKASPLARLRTLCDAWFDYVEQRVLPGGCFVTATANEYRTRPCALQDQVQRHRANWQALLERLAVEAKRAGEMRSDVDAQQLVFELTAFQMSANMATLMGDDALFARARRSTRRRIAAAAA